MSYLVLARKHRPKTFSEVVGQEHITKTLAGALSSGRLAHAFCFTGPRGVGKTSVARILAKSLNCQEGPTATPCNNCSFCREIDEGRSIDVQEIDAASNSRVEDVRELREMIRYRPQAARFRVTILDEVHMLSKAAFNALLKTLEEPPEHAVFILATTDVHKVPLTILSRCQRYDFRRLSPKTLSEHLAQVLKKEDCTLASQSLTLMAREADGSVRDALSLMDQVLSLGRPELSHQEVVELLGLVDRELVRSTAKAVLAGKADLILDLIGQVYAAGGEMQSFYAALQEHFRNLAAAQAAPAGMEIFGLTDEELRELREQAQEASPETLHEIFDHLARSEDLFRRASQPRLVMEMTLLKLAQVRPVLSLDDVLSRLQAAQGEPEPDETSESQEPQSGAATSRPIPAASSPVPVKEASARDERPKPMPGAEAALRELSAYTARLEPILGSMLGRALVQMQNEIMVITLPSGPMTAAQCTAENETKLERFWRELFSSVLRIKLTAAPAQQEPDKDLSSRAALAGKLAEHPVVQEAVEIFEAQVVALNPSIPDNK